MKQHSAGRNVAQLALINSLFTDLSSAGWVCRLFRVIIIFFKLFYRCILQNIVRLLNSKVLCPWNEHQVTDLQGWWSGCRRNQREPHTSGRKRLQMPRAKLIVNKPTLSFENTPSSVNITSEWATRLAIITLKWTVTVNMILTWLCWCGKQEF